VRPDAGGHMFVQHYLDNMFGPKQDFLDQPMVNLQHQGTSKTGDPQNIGADQKSVRQVSRLAGYLHGKSPPEDKRE
jgi:hypothetical protein